MSEYTRITASLISRLADQIRAVEVAREHHGQRAVDLFEAKRAFELEWSRAYGAGAIPAALSTAELAVRERVEEEKAANEELNYRLGLKARVQDAVDQRTRSSLGPGGKSMLFAGFALGAVLGPSLSRFLDGVFGWLN